MHCHISNCYFCTLALLQNCYRKNRKKKELEREKHAQATVNVESKQEIEALKHIVNKGLEREVAELQRQQDDDSLHPYVHAFPIEFVIKEEQ